MTIDFGITTISSKGQIVIPKDLRKGYRKGDKLLLIRDGKTMVLKHADKFEEQLEEDLEFARRTEAAWKEYEQGKFKKMSADQFLKELEKW